MPPKRNPASIAPPDDRTDPSPSVDQPTLEEYNDLVATHRETLRRIQELEATQAEQIGSSHTSTGLQEHLRDPKVEPSPEFSGKISEFPNFMAACSLVFTLCPNTYSSNERKVLFVISRLRRMAMSWARIIAEDPAHPYHKSYPAFKTALSNLYSDRNLQARNEDRLWHLVQTKSAAAYAAEFQSLVNLLDFDDNSKYLLFHKGLKPRVKDTIANVGRAATFTLLLDQAISINQRKHQRELEEKKSSSSGPKSSTTSQPSSTKAGVNAAEDRNPHFTRSRTQPESSQPRGQKRPAPKGPISQQEKCRRIAESLCLYCEEYGHMRFDCPKKSKTESIAVVGRY